MLGFYGFLILLTLVWQSWVRFCKPRKQAKVLAEKLIKIQMMKSTEVSSIKELIAQQTNEEQLDYKDLAEMEGEGQFDLGATLAAKFAINAEEIEEGDDEQLTHSFPRVSII